MSEEVPADIAARARAQGVELASIGGALARYLDGLLETNRTFNLTSVTDRGEAWSKHILDSLTLVGSLRTLAPGARVIDVGSGGGLPGVPLAIALPELRFTLLEATAKKARFLGNMASELGLSNVEVVSERAETFARGADRERFDAVTSRALSRLSVLLELTVPLLKVEGRSYAIKGEQAQREIEEAARALTLLHAEIERTERTPTGTIVVIRKRAPTGAQYPRRPGEPKRAPL